MTSESPVSPPWTYRAGQHWAVVGVSAAALLLGESSLGLAERIWTLLSDPEGDIERVLDEIAHDGVVGLPPFVLVEHSGGTLRAVVRGIAEAELHVAGNAAARSLSGVGFRSWREEVVPDAVSAVLADSRDGKPDGPELPILGGIVRAAELRLQFGELRTTESRAAHRPDVPEPATPPEPVPAVDVSLTLDESQYDPDGPPADLPVPTEPPLMPAEATPPPEPSPPPVPPQPPVAPEPEDEYLELVSGMTRMGTVEDAAVRAPGTEISAPPPAVDEPAPPPAPATPKIPTTGPPSHRSETPAKSPKTPKAPTTSPGLISSVPFASASSAGTRAKRAPSRLAPTPDPPKADEDAELTLVRVPGGPSGPDGGTSGSDRLPAVVCGKGHANPPESERCRLCEEDLSSAERQWVDRPVIGRLRFDGPPGVVQVNGPMVIGRAPRVDRVSGDAVPALVTVPSADGDVSRSHLRVAVEGWHVMVVDLNATNGTVVQDPTGESRRLHPGEEKMIVPGSRVVLADVVGFVFEAQP